MKALLLLFVVCCMTLRGTKSCHPSTSNLQNLSKISSEQQLPVEKSKLNETKPNLKTLKLVQVVFCHGERTPIFSFPKDKLANSTIYGVEEGELTSIGKRQSFFLGRFLRRRYTGFINASYSIDEVLATSSDTEATITSLQTCLAGLFAPNETKNQTWNPDMNWQPIPVHVIPAESDNKIDFSDSLECPSYRFEVEYMNLLFNTLMAEEGPLVAYISERTGLNMSDMYNFYNLYDTLKIQNLYKLPLPPWAKIIFPGVLKRLANNVAGSLFFTEKMLKLRGGPLLQDMIFNMDLLRVNLSLEEQEIEAYRKAKMRLYSGDHFTVTSLLAALRNFNGIIPPYASSVIVELHKKKTGPYFIKFFYRNDSLKNPRELRIHGCINKRYRGCLLDKLKKRKSHLISEDWNVECETYVEKFNATEYPTDLDISSCFWTLISIVFPYFMSLLNFIGIDTDDF